ncbi:MAG: DUF721 domain-containing protein [Azoarcus sp.]|jgi:hypothetical protein|nr:DUF721 domain-containing protein [Azoarcus sp.]
MSTLLHRYLDRDTPLARLVDHAARLQRLQRVLAAGLPAQYAHACRVANLKDDTLIVNVRGSAIAVRLKQTIPTLLEHFAHAGHPLQRIRIKIELPDSAPAPRPPPARVLSDAAQAHIETFAATLPADAPLRGALETLTRRKRPPV